MSIKKVVGGSILLLVGALLAFQIFSVAFAGSDNTAKTADQEQDEQEPKYDSSISVDEARYEGLSEAEEAKALAPLATITEDRAVEIAEAELGGTASEVELESENGALVYEVEVGGQEAKVDAGNGDILHIENNDDDTEADDDDKEAGETEDD